MILVTGANGQLGGDVCNYLEGSGVPFIGTDIDTLDITDIKNTESFFDFHNVDCIIHCAAYTAVDKAEDEKEKCFLVNKTGTRNLAICAKRANAKMLYISTDYVFDGKGEKPFEVNDPKGPLNIYGESKLKGEEAIKESCKRFFIVRTSWVFGEKNRNFIATMLRLSETHSEVSVVCDQIGSPTYSKHLAKTVCAIAQSEKYGIYHATNEGFCSWAELAAFAFETADKTTTVKPVQSSEYKTKAARPCNSRLSKNSLDEGGFERLPDWKDAVREYLGNIF